MRPSESVEELVEGVLYFAMAEWMISSDGSALFAFLRDNLGAAWAPIYNLPFLTTDLTAFAFREIVQAEVNPVHRRLFDLLMESCDPAAEVVFPEGQRPTDLDP